MPTKRSVVSLVLGIVLLVSRSYVVHGQSMEPTLHTNERIVTEKASYLFVTPARGDVVILGDGVTGSKQFVKRVIGLSNEKIAIRKGLVYINDQPLKEPYPLHLSITSNLDPIVIPSGSVFVLGDNRGNSNDSRDFGPVSTNQIRGRVLFSYWPLQAIDLIG